MNIETEFGLPRGRETTYRFLYQLQAEGRINMYAAPKVLQQQFGLDSRTSHELFQDWADNWDASSFEEAKENENGD